KTTGDGVLAMLATFDGPVARSGARCRSAALRVRGRCAPVCIPARSRCGVATSGASRFTRQPASYRNLRLTRTGFARGDRSRRGRGTACQRARLLRAEGAAGQMGSVRGYGLVPEAAMKEAVHAGGPEGT